MNDIRIEADDIAFSYGEPRVLRNISLNIEAGELFSVVGPSGAGKSTLLRMIAGLEQPSTGRILINGMDANEIPLTQRSVGMVFQDFALWPHMTVFENVAFGASPGHDAAGVPLAARVERWLSLLDIGETRDTRPAFLSMGQQQRAALARALITEPRLLLLDDPFSNLEQRLRKQLRHDLRQLQRKLGITAILVTHDLEDAFSIADRIAVVIGGMIRQVGTPTAIYDFPNSIDVARFVGVENFVPGKLKHAENPHIEFQSPDIGLFRWPMRERPPEGDAILSIRPRALRLCPIDSFRDGRYSWIEGKVAASEFLGEVIRYRVVTGAIELSVEAPHFPGSPATPPGILILIGFNPSHARLFPAQGDGVHAAN
jgi:iron(III) transport system ATP-binding protein